MVLISKGFFKRLMDESSYLEQPLHLVVGSHTGETALRPWPYPPE